MKSGLLTLMYDNDFDMQSDVEMKEKFSLEQSNIIQVKEGAGNRTTQDGNASIHE